MAITPISQYRGQDNSLQQILQGGTETIAGILQNAIQLGRDRVNNQARQEDQMFQQRAQETALAQRRGENLSASIADSRRMSLAQRNADRNYGLLERQDARSSAQNLFSNDLAIERLEQGDRRLDMAESAAGREDPFAAAMQGEQLRGARLLNQQRERALNEPDLPEGEGLSDAEQRQRFKLEADQRAEEARGILTELFPDERALNTKYVNELAVERGKEAKEIIPTLSPRSQQILSKDFDQFEDDRSKIVASESFEDFIAKKREPEGGWTPEKRALAKRAYDNIKFGVTPMNGAAPEPDGMVLPPKDPQEDADPLESLFEGL